MGRIAESDEFFKNHPQFKYFFYVIALLIIIFLCVGIRNAYNGKAVSVGSGGITLGDTTSNKSSIAMISDTVKSITNKGNNSGIMGDNNSLTKNTVKKEGPINENIHGTQIIHSVSGLNNNVGVNGDVTVVDDVPLKLPPVIV